MQQTITITTDGGDVIATGVPFDEKFRAAAADLRGWWDGTSWRFRWATIDQVTVAVGKCFGKDAVITSGARTADIATIAAELAQLHARAAKLTAQLARHTCPLTAEGADTMNTHTTIADLIAREITPALDDVSPGFDTSKLVSELEKAGLIECVPGGFRLVTSPDFWTLVQQIDAETAPEQGTA